MAPLVWLITGTTSGIGAALVEHILSRGDKVIATGRKVDKRLAHLPKSDNLALLELDISAGFTVIDAQIQKAWALFGHIDVLMNNAGMSAVKTAEEADDTFVNTMFTTNLFGPMHITRAALPLLRAQGHGTLAFTSSSTAWTPLPFMTHYAASKAALSAFADGLRREVRPLGLRAVAFECGGFPTHLGQARDGAAGFGAAGPAVPEYQPLFGELMGTFAADPMAHMPGDLAGAAAAMVDVLKEEERAQEKPWAVRVAVGSDGMGAMRQRCEEQLVIGERFKEISASSDREGQDVTIAGKQLFKFTTMLEAA